MPPVSPQWIHTWVAAPQLTEPDNLPPPPFTHLADTTLRQTVHASLGGRRVRLRLSNAFGRAPLPIASVSLARPLGDRAGVARVEPDTSRPVTFHGGRSTVVPAGAQVVSDPLSVNVAAGSNLTVTVYLAEGLPPDEITSHPGSRTTSYLVHGDHVDAADLTGAAAVDHWYLLSGLEVWTEDPATAMVALGDSLTDGRSSTTNGNDRWPDGLRRRLCETAHGDRVAVLNQGIGGNRVLADG